MKRLAEESQRFRVEDVPPRLHEKERVAHSFREIEKQLRDSGEQLGMFSNNMLITNFCRNNFEHKFNHKFWCFS